MRYFFYTGWFVQDGNSFFKSGTIKTDSMFFPFKDVYDSFKMQDGKFTIGSWQEINQIEFVSYNNRHGDR